MKQKREADRKKQRLARKVFDLDRLLKKDEVYFRQLQFKMNRLSKKLISVFRQNNPELRHFSLPQICDYCDLLVKESQMLRTPSNPLLVIGGVFFILINSIMLSIMISRVFYHHTFEERMEASGVLAASQHYMFIEFGSLKNRLVGVSMSVFTSMVLVPIISIRCNTDAKTATYSV